MANPDQKTLMLQMEVSGCLGACPHCWAEGHPYSPMMVDDIERILTAAARFCQSEGMRFKPQAMHDVLTHKDALKIMQLFDAYCHPSFEPFTTPGPVLAQRTDWEEILNGAKQLGTTTLWFTFHGLGDVQDQAVNRRGAFAQAVTAIQRGKSAGLRCGACFYVTAVNLHQIPQSIEFCHSVGLNELSFGIANYRPNPRLRAYETVRPELRQLTPYADCVAEVSRFWNDQWCNLDRYTEAYYVNHTLMEHEPGDVTWPDLHPELSLVCRSNMDLHTGYAGIYGPFHGNLGVDDVRLAFENAREVGPLPTEKLYWPKDRILPLSELASRWGNPKGQKVYMDIYSMARCWLDRALAGKGE